MDVEKIAVAYLKLLCRYVPVESRETTKSQSQLTFL
jgi:hypothetical protein